MSDFVIGHISDLHFSEGTDQSNPSHTHSIEHLKALENIIPPPDSVDLLIASGDLSNYGDQQSLINASAYLFNNIPIGQEMYTGLKFPKEKIGVVPGNHDAWNCHMTGPLADRRQKSLEHYNFAFKSHSINPEHGCYYDWIEKDGCGIYIAYLDSCFLGDTDEKSNSTFGTLRYDQAVAKGKLSVKQTEKLLEWHDQGVSGKLENPRNPTTEIDKELFAKSLKILVMHHYLFEPPEHSSDYFMRLRHRDVVFRNIAFSDFDVLMCGHKHIPAFDTHTYGHHFDHVSTNRFLINCFRRLIGLHSLPMQLVDDEGNKWSRALTMLVNVLLRMFRKTSPTINSDELAKGIISLLKQGLEKPDDLERTVKKFIHEQGVTGAEVLERQELKEIQKRISVGLSIAERKQIKEVACKIMRLSKRIKSRPFLQVMSGSSGKKCEKGDRLRAFNIYRIHYEANRWKFRSERYTWDWDSRSYSDVPFPQEHTFDKSM